MGGPGNELSLMASKEDKINATDAEKKKALAEDEYDKLVEKKSATNADVKAKHADVEHLKKEYKRLNLLVEYLPHAVMKHIGWAHPDHPRSRYFVKRPGKMQINISKANYGWQHTPGIAAQKAIAQDHLLPHALGSSTSSPMVYRFTTSKVLVPGSAPAFVMTTLDLTLIYAVRFAGATNARNGVQDQFGNQADPIVTMKHIRSLLEAGVDHGNPGVKANCEDTLSIIDRNCDRKIGVVAGIHSTVSARFIGTLYYTSGRVVDDSPCTHFVALLFAGCIPCGWCGKKRQGCASHHHFIRQQNHREVVFPGA